MTAARHATHADEDADADGSPVRYVCGDLDSLPWRAAPFDLVVCNHVFSHLPDPTRPITEFSRVLRPGGRLAVLMLHPCFYAANIERGVAPGIPATEYFARREIRQRFLIDGAESPAMFTSFIRPLEFYFRALTDAGFAITGLSEPHPTAERLQDDSWWGQAFPAPLFLLITATRARDL